MSGQLKHYAGEYRKAEGERSEMLRTLALSAVAAAGLLFTPVQVTTSSAAPSIAPKIATPESAVEHVRRGGGRSIGGGRGMRAGSFRGGRSFGGRSFRGGRSFSGRSFRGSRIYSGRSYRGGRGFAYYGGRHRHRGWGRGLIIGAGIPFLYGGSYYGGSYYGGCNYYYRKWKRTGSRYWRHRYYSCAGYW